LIAEWEHKLQKVWNSTKWLIERLRVGYSGMDSLNQAARFIATYHDIQQEDCRIVEKLLHLRNEGMLGCTRRVLHPHVERNNSFDDFGLKAMLLIGWH
jgi:hypothetical protein